MKKQKGKRFILKMSGEALCEKDRNGCIGGLNAGAAWYTAEIRAAYEDNHIVSTLNLAAATGPGQRLLRKMLRESESLLEERTAHQIGMLFTLVNALAMKDVLRRMLQKSKVKRAEMDIRWRRPS